MKKFFSIFTALAVLSYPAETLFAASNAAPTSSEPLLSHMTIKAVDGDKKDNSAAYKKWAEHAVRISGQASSWTYQIIKPGPGSDKNTFLEFAVRPIIISVNGGEQAIGFVNLTHASDDYKKETMSERKWQFILRLPLRLYLPLAPSVQIDKGKSFQMQWMSCVENGCIAELELKDNSDILKQLIVGKNLHVSTQRVVNGKKQNVDFDIPIDGLGNVMPILEDAVKE